MKILLVNDDGINADGIISLEKALSAVAEVYVVAPDEERSACSHSITLRRPISATKLSDRKYSIDGVPADCVNLALLHLFADVDFDLVLSGINNGHNTGEDISYSGTVAGAIEATSLGRRAMALSIGYSERPDFGAAREFAREFVVRFPMNELPPICFLNINFPKGKGPFPVMVTRQGRLHFENSVTQIGDDAALDGTAGAVRRFKIGRTTERGLADEGTDVYAVNRGYISITPMHVDLTDLRAFEKTEHLVFQAMGSEAKNSK
ncbi:MAG: 5'/3'-nucleotidase SurE [Candidatus Coatesbacteria bacterium]|nr:5'/3'-nucleotidase SurE [Candidatus Coatesbacteria bacterium]